MIASTATVGYSLVPRLSPRSDEKKNPPFFGESLGTRLSRVGEIWGVASFGMAKVSNPRKFSPRKLYFHQFTKVFSLESFPLYDIQHSNKVQSKCRLNVLQLNLTFLGFKYVLNFIKISTKPRGCTNAWMHPLHTSTCTFLSPGKSPV